jgi:small-conductance mechanosensitive channel
MYKTDIAAGIVLFIAGMVTLTAIIPAQISGHSDYGLPPDFFPRLLTWMFIGLVGLLAAHRLILLRVLGKTKQAAGDGEAPMKAADWAFIGGVTVFLVIVFLVMKHLGFIAAGVLTIATVAALMGGARAHLPLFIALTAIAPFAIYYAFRHLFLVFLPF